MRAQEVVPTATALAYVTARAPLLAPPPDPTARGGAAGERRRRLGFLPPATPELSGAQSCGEPGNARAGGARHCLPSRSLTPWQHALGAA